MHSSSTMSRSMTSPRSPHSPASGSPRTPRNVTPRNHDSPSRQLMMELTRDLEQMRIQSFEMKMIKAYERRSYYENLDKVDQERTQHHESALDAAAAKQETIRKGAEEALERHLQRQEEKRKKKEEAERLRKERIAQKNAEKERKRREAAERAEAKKKQQEEERRKAEEEKEKAAKAEEEQKAKQEKDRLEAEQKKKEEEERQKAEAQLQEEAAKTTTTTFGYQHRTPDEIQRHNRYLEIHKHLKGFRRWMETEAKSNMQLKSVMGDMRRSIKKCAGQLLLDDKKANRKPTMEVQEILTKALTMATPSVDVRQFIAFPPPQILNSPNPQVPALFIYLLNMFSKAIIAQLIAEAGIQPKTAEPLGVFAAQIFSVPDFNYQGVPMIDILLAKYHVVCPVLFGFYGPENTADGKDAIGWWRDDRSAGGPFVPVQNHEERMIGLAAGYAALTLRNFSKAKRANPLPNRHFWTAIAYILNTPPAEVQETHLFVLSSLLTNSAARVVGFWGDLGLALLHRAIVDFPASLSKSSPGKSAVEVLRITYANEKGIVV